MAHIVLDGKDIEIVDADDIDGREIIEAENALKMDFLGENTTGTQRMMISVYVSVRRVDKGTPEGVLADKVLNAKFAKMMVTDDEEPEPADPLAGTNGAAQATGELPLEPASRQTSGSPRSDTSST